MLVVTLALCLSAQPARPLVISSVPFDDATRQAAVFGILSQKLAGALGEPVSFEQAKSYDDVIEKLSQGQVDLAFIGAATYVKARKRGDVRAILTAVRHRSTTYRGIVIVPKAKATTKLADLRGKRVAFVDPTSTAGFLFPRELFKKAGIDVAKDLEAVFAGGHVKVAEMVAKGEVDAGACFETAPEALTEPGAVVPIARTDAVPGDPVVVRPGLGAARVQALRASLVALSTHPDAAPFFTFAEIDGFVPAVDRDYDGVVSMVQALE